MPVATDFSPTLARPRSTPRPLEGVRRWLVLTAGALATGLGLGLLPAVDASAAEVRTRSQLEVLNSSGTALVLDPAADAALHRGGSTVSKPEPQRLAAGASSTLDLGYAATLEWSEDIGYINDFANHLVLGLTPDGVTGPVQVLLTHSGRTYTEEEIATVPTLLESFTSDRLALRLENVGGQPSGFAHRYRLTITDKVRPVLETGDAWTVGARRLTGSGKPPVYRLTMPAYQMRFGSLPDELEVPSYAVRGRDAAGGWHAVGTVVPVGAPQIDRADKTVALPETTFTFENPVDGQAYEALEVRMTGTGTAAAPPPATVQLSMVLGPPAGLSQADITELSATPATGLGVTANGVAQETLKVKLTASGETVNADDFPELARLYDYVYFRDTAGRLVDGLFNPVARGGYTSVSTARGGFVNELTPQPAMSRSAELAATATNNQRLYVSTTSAEELRLVAHLEVDDSRVSAESTVSRAPATDVATASNRAVTLQSGGMADPEVGALHHHNGTRPSATLLTRYRAQVATASLPVAPLWRGGLTLTSGGALAVLSPSAGLESQIGIESHVVNRRGTYVQLVGL